MVPATKAAAPATAQWSAPAPAAAWSPPPPAPTPAPAYATAPGAGPGQSGMRKAGTILLLIGAILHAIGAFFLLIFSAFMLALGGTLAEGPDFAGLAFVGVIYLVLGLVVAAGGAVGFSAWRQAKAGQLHSAWIRGLVSALLPPLQIVTLLGAIFILVSPEHEAEERARQAWGTPR